ncbi:DUF4097 family beta strand repeat-containing protein [Spirillospora sp. NPDC048832]
MRTLTGTAALAAVAAATLTACGNVSFGSGHEDRSYSAPAGATKLRIEGTSDRVVVTASDSPGIEVSERLRWSNDKNKPKVEHVTEGGTVKLTAKCGGQAIGIGMSSCGVSYRVRVPRSLPVEVESRDGRIDASGLSGTVRLHSENGSIRATDLNASSVSLVSQDGSVRISGRVTTADIRSQNGSVNANGLTAGTLKVRSADGSIQLSGTATVADLRSENGGVHATGLTTDRLTARSSDGGIDLRLAAPPKVVDAEADSGSIKVCLPPGDEGYAITAHSVDGGKDIDPGIHEDSRSDRKIKLSTRDGGILVAPY